MVCTMADIGLASVIVSVDVVLPEAWDTTATAIERTAGDLLNRLNSSGIVATWGLSDVAHPLGDEIVDQSSHELAMIVGGQTHRTTIARDDLVSELQRRINAARMVGREPTTVHLAAGCKLGQLDILSKLGINAVRNTPTGERRSMLQRWFGAGRRMADNELPHMIRWGVWQFPVHLDVDVLSVRELRRTIDRAIAGGWQVIAALNVATAIRHPRRWQSAIDALVRHVSRRQNEGSLLVQTIDQTVARLSLKHIGRPSQSILRLRAA
jgi:hypothetical protein